MAWGKAIGLGLLVWLVPFLVAVLASPIKDGWRSLFESIMPLTLSMVVVACTCAYSRRALRYSLKEGVCLGLLWWGLCVAIDLPLMLNPPLNYSLTEYAADVGLTYAMIPVITVGMAFPPSNACQRDGDITQ